MTRQFTMMKKHSRRAMAAAACGVFGALLPGCAAIPNPFSEIPNPLLLAAVPLGLILAFSRVHKKRLAAAGLLLALWGYVLLGGLFTMAIKLLPAFYQQNQVTQALLLPPALALVLIMAGLRGFILNGKFSGKAWNNSL
jgi:hypothetical protein